MGRERKNSLAAFIGGSSTSKGGFSSSFGGGSGTKDEIEVYHVGLMNLGNSCFYNTILQSLSCTIPLTTIIQHPPPSSPSLLYLSSSSPSSSSPPKPPLSPLPITTAFLDLLATLNPIVEGRGGAGAGAGGGRKSKAFNPKGLLRELSVKHEEYAQATQQDSHEVLRHLIDGVMMEEVDLIKKIVEKETLDPSTSAVTTTATSSKRRKLPKKRSTLKSTPASTSTSNGGEVATTPTREKRKARRMTLRPGAKDGEGPVPVSIKSEGGKEGEEAAVVDGDDDGDDEDESDDDAVAAAKEGKVKGEVGEEEEGEDEDEEEEDEDERVHQYHLEHRRTDLESSSDSSSSDSDTSTASSSTDNTGGTGKSKKKVKKVSKAMRKKQEELKKTMRPFIDQVFGGKLASVVICDECKNVSLTREDFMDLSLSLKDDSLLQMRKRDRIRKTLQAGFFSKKSSESSKSSASSATSSSRPSPRPSLRREPTSLSEAEASASSASEASSVDDSDGNNGQLRHTAGALVNRRKSLDPAQLRESKRPTWAAKDTGPTSTSRDASPLGRALSVMGGKHRPQKGKIPKPTHEQLAYIKRVLADIPGPAMSPLPNQLRWSVPPGQEAPPTKALAAIDLQQSQNATSTDLYASLLQFTGVETLEGENSFACRNCWKLLNPELVKKRREAKEARHQAREERARSRGEMGKEVTTSVVPPTPSANSPETSSTTLVEPKASSDATSNSPALSAFPPSPIFSQSNSSLPSDVGTNESLSDGEAIAGNLADVESNNTSSISINLVDVDALPKLPLTTENVAALTPGSLTDKVETSSSVATLSIASPSAPPTRPPSPSGASLSTRPSVKSFATRTSAVPSVAPPRAARHILRKAHKRYLISAGDLPPVLCFHFKRFQQTKNSLFGTAFTNLKKRDDDLSFPQEMDLTPFLAPLQKPPKGATPGRSGSDAKSKKVTDLPPGSAKYRLYAVVVHSGTLSLGHYISYVLSDRWYEKGKSVKSSIVEEGKDEKEKDDQSSTTSSTSRPRRWFYTSDDEVRACSVDEVLNSKAYMLFYERVQTTTDVQIKSRM